MKLLFSIKKFISIISIIFFVLSCSKDETPKDIDDNQEVIIEMVHEELVNQEILTINDIETFREKLNIAKDNIEVTINTSYNADSDKTTTTLSVLPKSSSVSSITIIQNIPKEIAQSASDIDFSVAPTKIIKDDPLIMWHLKDVKNNYKFDFASFFKGNYKATGTTIILANYYYNGNQFDNGARTTNIKWGVTDLAYKDNSDWDAIVNDIFGPGYRVADWNDLKEFYNSGGDIASLFDELELTKGKSAFLTRNGDRNYSSTRYYFATRHDHNKPSSYLAHDHIDNYLISLGSWYTTMKIMVVKK